MNETIKHTINSRVESKWQNKVDLLHDLLDVSAVVIMILHPNELEVFVGSNNIENPFVTGDRGELNLGSYCDSVIASKAKVQIEDAAGDDLWKEKVERNNGMCCYQGLPVLFPNEDLFGTLCIMNKECRGFSETENTLIEHFKESIENDLLIEEQRESLENSTAF